MSVFVVIEAELCMAGEGCSHISRTPVPISVVTVPNMKGVEVHFGDHDVQFRAIMPGPEWAKKGICISSSAWIFTHEKYQLALALWDP